MAEVPEPGRSEKTVTLALPSRNKALADPTHHQKGPPQQHTTPTASPRSPNRRQPAPLPAKNSLAPLLGTIQQDISPVLNLTLISRHSPGSSPPPPSWQRPSPQQTRRLPLPIQGQAQNHPWFCPLSQEAAAALTPALSCPHSSTHPLQSLVLGRENPLSQELKTKPQERFQRTGG